MEPVFDHQLLIERRRRALRRLDPGADFLVRHVADDLADRLSAVERRFSVAVALFGTVNLAPRAILASSKAGSIKRVEADPAFLQGEPGIVAEPDHVPLEPASRDLIVSLMHLQEANDVPGLLVQVRRALMPDGLFLAAFPGAGTLAELRESLLAAEMEISGGASPRVSPLIDVRDAGALLQRAGFALPVTDIDTVTVRYASMFGLMKDLKAMGASNALVARTRRPTRRSLFMRAAEIYAERFSDADGKVRATFNIVWMSGWAPHESQQKPLKPGSATASLAQVLKEDGG